MQYKYVVLTNTTIGAFMAILDANVVLIALPTIIARLPGTSTFDGVWIIMGYMLITATLLLTFGRLSDVFGRVRLYTLGFAVFTVGSALCSLSPNGTALVAFRLVQGTGGALIFSNSTAILTDVFPPQERGKALGINQVAGTVGSVGGLVVGGILTGSLGWQSIFWINIPVGAFATVWAYTRLRETSSPSRGERLDPIGNALFAVGLSAFLLGLTLGAISGWSVALVGTTLVGLAMLGAFVFVESKVKFPMMDLSLFRNRAFSAGILSNLLSFVARGALSLMLVFYFQGALGLNALSAGLMLVPFSLAFVSFGPLSGYLSDRFGSRWFATAGVLISAGAIFWFSVFPFGAPYGELVIPMVMAGIGGGMFIAPNIASIMNATPPARRGVASGMSSTLVNTGFLLSLGFAFAIMAVSVPISTLQAIFAGQAVTIDPLGIQLFIGSMRKVFMVMAAVSLIAAIPASMTGPRVSQKVYTGEQVE
ncbi:MAG: MFS transporter [Nitrososphaerales archaeon]|nr:MFS transporter [Nitrososphaerales archaeon]